MWITWLMIVVCMMIGTGYSQQTRPQRPPLTDPTITPSKPTKNPAIPQGECIDRLTSIQSANSSNRRYIAIPKRGQNRLKFLRRFPDRVKTVAIQSDQQPGRGSGRDLPVALISAEEAKKVSYIAYKYFKRKQTDEIFKMIRCS